MNPGDLVYSRDPLTWNLWEITLRVGDLVKYRRLHDEDESSPTWVRIKDLTGIVLSPDAELSDTHIRILWDTGEVHVHLVPPYDSEVHFEVIS